MNLKWVLRLIICSYQNLFWIVKPSNFCALIFPITQNSHLPFNYAMQIMQSSLLLHVESIVKVCIKHLSVVFFVFQSSEIALISNSTVTFIWFAFVLPNKYIHLKKTPQIKRINILLR